MPIWLKGELLVRYRFYKSHVVASKTENHRSSSSSVYCVSFFLSFLFYFLFLLNYLFISNYFLHRNFLMPLATTTCAATTSSHEILRRKVGRAYTNRRRKFFIISFMPSNSACWLHLKLETSLFFLVFFNIFCAFYK